MLNTAIRGDIRLIWCCTLYLLLYLFFDRMCSSIELHLFIQRSLMLWNTPSTGLLPGWWFLFTVIPSTLHDYDGKH